MLGKRNSDLESIRENDESEREEEEEDAQETEVTKINNGYQNHGFQSDETEGG